MRQWASTLALILTFVLSFSVKVASRSLGEATGLRCEGPQGKTDHCKLGLQLKQQMAAKEMASGEKPAAFHD